MIFVDKTRGNRFFFFCLKAKGKQRQFGWFPSSYVRIMTSSGSARSTPVQEFDDQLAGFSSPAPPTIQVGKSLSPLLKFFSFLICNLFVGSFCLPGLRPIWNKNSAKQDLGRYFTTDRRPLCETLRSLLELELFPF